MKNTLLFTLFLFLFASSVAAQTPKVVALVSKATWCAVCKKHMGKVNNIMPKYYQRGVMWVDYNLTDESTKAHTALMMTSLGISDLMRVHQSTGQIILVDYEKKKIVNFFTFANTEQDIIIALEQAIARAETSAYTAPIGKPKVGMSSEPAEAPETGQVMRVED